MCQSKFSLILSHPIRNTGMVAEAKCGCWKCSECGIDLRRNWLDRVSHVIRASAMWEHSVCNQHQFEALTRRLRKQDRVYFRIRIEEVSYVFHEPLMANRKYRPDESRWMGSGAALNLFEEILFRSGVTRVSCSRAVPPKEREKSGWKREAVQRRTVPQLNEFLARLLVGQAISHAKAFDGRLLDIILLRGFPDLRSKPSNDPSIPVEENTRIDVVEQNRKTRIIRREPLSDACPLDVPTHQSP